MYTSYLGGSGLQQVTAIAVDSEGNTYITGYTSSPDFPVIGGVQKALGGSLDSFVAKLDAKGRNWLYCTYLGGRRDDLANGIAIDSQGNAYITGRTTSTDGPVKSGAFVAAIAADGSALRYATSLGLGADASGNAIATDSEGGVYVAGAAGGHGFFLKMAADGSKAESVRTVDGAATAIAVDAEGAIYLAGLRQSEMRAGAVFAAKFAADGRQVYDTPIDGATGGTAPTIAADSLGNAYVAAGASGRQSLLAKLSAAGDRQLAAEMVATLAGSRAAMALGASGRAIVAGAGAAGQAYAAAVPTCAFHVSETAKTIGAGGGSTGLTIETSPECQWRPESSPSWLEVSGTGAGGGALTLRVAVNRGAARSGAVTVGGETVVVRQEAIASSSSTAGSAIRANPGFRASTLEGCDDCSTAESIDLGFAIDFYSQTYTQAWINANGNLTFGAADGSYAPKPLAELRNAMIAPFWADVDTRGTGSIRYGRDLVDGHAAFGVTWTDTGYYPQHQDQTDSFQVVLIERGDLGPGFFDIEMNYGSLEWDAAEAGSRADARAGFTNGTGEAGTYFELPGSGERAAMLDGGRQKLLGRHTFAVRPLGTGNPPAAAPSGMAPTAAATPGVAISLPQPPLAPQLATGTITEYAIPISGSAPYGIVAGPDGALWITDWAGYIARSAINGAMTEVPDAASDPRNIVVGPDNNLWFVDTNNSKIGTVTAAGVIAEYPTQTPAAAPHNLVSAPDGNLWFTEYNVGKIGRITPAGLVTEFALSHNYDQPEGIAVGPDGALWFTEYAGAANKIGRITTTGAITEFTVPTNGAEPGNIVTGSDNNLWFTEFNTNKIARLTPGGTFTEFVPPTANSEPWAIVSGPDGAVWFTEYAGGQIGRITTSGTITEYAIPTTVSEPDAIAVGPDQSIWFTEHNRGKIARVAISSPPSLGITKTHAGSFAPSQQGATYTVTVSNAAAAAATSGTVTVTEMPPAGLSLVSMAGSGWTCPSGGTVCTRSDALAGGASYPAITVTVNVAYAADSPQVNAVSVAGGGSASSSVNDPTVITSAPAVGTITEYPVAISSSQPFGIATGPDGALWFTDWAGYIGRSTAKGGITEAPDEASDPRAIILGPDNALWFVDTNGSKIGRVATDGTIVEYPTPTASAAPHNIVVGPDGAMWFTEFNVAKIGRITTAGVTSEFALSHNYDQPEGIAVGPDGALWFTEYAGAANNIGRITTTGTITEFAVPTNGAEPSGIVTGPDGALWFTEFNANRIGRMTTLGVFTEYVLPTANSEPWAMIVGPDGAMWFAEYASNQIGRITAAGAIAEYPIPTTVSEPETLTIGPDGAVWFTEFNRGKLGRIVVGNTDPPSLSITKSHTGSFTPGQQGATYAVTVSNAAAAGMTSGTVTVNDAVPAGESLVSMSGTGWTCSAAACTRSDGLAGGASYPPITVTVNVAAAASSPQVNQATVSGGGSAPASASDSTAISAGGAAGTITEYPVPISSSEPYGIATGPDGALWFTDAAGYIGRMTTAGAVTEVPDFAAGPRGIVTGPDGNLWFADTNNGKIGQVTPAGILTEFPTPTVSSAPHNLILGPDGNLWFTEFSVAKIGRITTAGVITEFPLAHNYDQPEGITVGPDGALWFTEYAGAANNIGRITTAGGITEFAIPSNGAQPSGIVAAPDGALWFTEFNTNRIGRMTTDGVFTEYVLPTANSEPWVMTLGPDGALWFAEYASNQIGRMTTGGLLSEYPIPTTVSEPDGITVGPDGALWFTEFNRAKIGRISAGNIDPPALSVTSTHIGNFTPGQSASYTVIVANAAGAGPTSGTVILTDLVSAGLTLVSMSGSGWSCTSGQNFCTRSDALAGGTSYPPITVTVNVSSTAASPQVNAATVSGGLSASASNSDAAIVTTLSVGTITENRPPTSNAGPYFITAGPDGALWFTEESGNKIGRITTANTFSEYTISTANSQPIGITQGPDGNLWFCERNGNKIGRITTAGVITEFSVPTASSQPVLIVAGPDGNLWFTEFAAGKIGRITPTGVVTEMPLSHNYDQPNGITVGPDGALWFTEYAGAANNIGRITTAGAITEFAVPANGAEPYGIVTGPDGALWFTEFNTNRVGRLTTNGVFKEYVLASSNSEPADIKVGPDGALWFTQYASDQIGRIIPSGLVTEYPIATNISEPLGIALGPDGAIWFCESNGNKIGRIVIGGAVTPALYITKTHSGSFTAGQTGAYTVTVSNAGDAATTSGLVTVTENPPAGMTVNSMAGAGWTCPGSTCSRSDALAPNASYPPITVSVNVAAGASSPLVNAVTVAGGGSTPNSATDITAISGASATSGLALYPVTPCRAADTRNSNGPFGGPIMTAGSVRSFVIPNSGCGIPANAQAYSLNITVVPPAPLTYLTAWPTGQTQPYVSTLNSFNGAVIANAAIVPAGAGGAISIFVSDATQVIIDINGYFAPPGGQGALAFYPATPCRVADTRNGNGPFGGPSLGAGSTRNFTVPQSGCGIPTSAQAYSLNMTVVPPGPLEYLTTWPAGQTQPYVSTLNALQGQIAANAAIVPAGTNGAISVFVSDPSNVIVDINGYFAPPGSPGALYFYPVTPCRVADTRNANGTFGGPSLGANSTRNFPIPSSACGLPSTAQAYSFNMTVVPPAGLLYLSTWPAGQSQPVVSTLNDTQGQVVANAAIVPAGSAGAISVFVSDATNLIIDVNGYFGQ
ncbi:MAG TPA: nidogen-like domain-containing protein [Verrucomicrobiae bacterium]|nr:nidogen-like domain-containing protein [Verrucomicrobiae bacterium]